MNNWFTQLTRSEYFELAGWSLIYSVWQGLFIALFIFFFLKATRGYLSSGIRYLIALTGQLLIVVLTVYTFIRALPFKSTNTPELGQVLLFFTNQEGFDLNNDLSLIGGFRNTIQGYIPFFMLVWVAGFVFFLIRIFGGLVYLDRVRKATLNASRELAGITSDLAERMGISQLYRLAESSILTNPVVTGHFKPLIILPAGIMSDLTMSEIKGILAHELAHIKRYDYLVNIFQSLIEAIYFFNPFVWWISGMIKEERERACDDLAVKCTTNPRSYAEALIKIKEREQAGKYILSPGITGHTNNSLIDRIKRITNKEMKSKPIDWLPALVLTAILVIPALLLARESVKKQNEFPVEPAIAKPVLNIDPPVSAESAIPVMIPPDTVPGKENKLRKIGPEPEEDVNLDLDLDHDLDISIPDPDLDLNLDLEIPPVEIPDLDLNMDIDLDLDLDLNLGSLTPPFSMNFRYPIDTIPADLNEEELRVVMEQWHKEMKELQLEMARVQKELEQNLQFSMQEWESAHRQEIEELQKRVQEEMSEAQMEKFRAQEEMSKSQMEKLRTLEEQMVQEFDQGEWQKDFQKQMKELQEKLEAMPEINESQVKEMQHKLQEEMTHLKDFEKEMKSMLLEDGYIKDADHVSIEFNRDELLVNGEKVKDKDFRKYDELRKRYFPEDEDFKFKMN